MDFGLASFLGTGISSAGSFFGQLAANKANREIAAQNQALVRETNAQNIAFQREENAITRQREDNAVQRAAADMQAAGLSKTLAAGSPASSAGLTAPQIEAPTLNHQEQNLMKDVNLAQTFMQLMSGFKTVEQQDAEIEKTKAETIAANIANGFLEQEHIAGLQLTNRQADYEEAKIEYQKWQTELSRLYGGAKYDAEIKSMVSNVNLNDEKIRYSKKEREKIAYDMAESIARTNKINADIKNVIAQTALAELEYKIKGYNLEFSQAADLRTTDSIPTMLGLPVGWFGKALDDAVLTPFKQTVSNAFSKVKNFFGF